MPWGRLWADVLPPVHVLLVPRRQLVLCGVCRGTCELWQHRTKFVRGVFCVTHSSRALYIILAAFLYFLEVSDPTQVRICCTRNESSTCTSGTSTEDFVFRGMFRLFSCGTAHTLTRSPVGPSRDLFLWPMLPRHSPRHFSCAFSFPWCSSL